MRHEPATIPAILLEILPHLKSRIDERLDLHTVDREVLTPSPWFADHHQDIDVAVGVAFAAQAGTAGKNTEQIVAEFGLRAVDDFPEYLTVLHASAPAAMASLGSAPWFSALLPPDRRPASLPTARPCIRTSASVRRGGTSCRRTPNLPPCRNRRG